MPDLRQTLRILQGLQELDRDLFKLQAQLKRFPEEVTRKREKLRAEADKLAEVEKKYTDSRVRLKEIEDLTSGQRQRVRKLEHEAGQSRADAALLVAFSTRSARSSATSVRPRRRAWRCSRRSSA